MATMLFDADRYFLPTEEIAGGLLIGGTHMRRTSPLSGLPEGPDVITIDTLRALTTGKRWNTARARARIQRGPAETARPTASTRRNHLRCPSGPGHSAQVRYDGDPAMAIALSARHCNPRDWNDWEQRGVDAVPPGDASVIYDQAEAPRLERTRRTIAHPLVRIRSLAKMIGSRCPRAMLVNVCIVVARLMVRRGKAKRSDFAPI